MQQSVIATAGGRGRQFSVAFVFALQQSAQPIGWRGHPTLVFGTQQPMRKRVRRMARVWDDRPRSQGKRADGKHAYLEVVRQARRESVRYA